jgi:hypothetical protein
MKHRSSLFTSGITRCRRTLRQELTRIFWLGFEAAFLLGITVALATYVFTKLYAPEWLINLELSEVFKL